MIKYQRVIKKRVAEKSLLLVSKQTDAQTSAPRVSALNARETDDRHGLFDPILSTSWDLVRGRA